MNSSENIKKTLGAKVKELRIQKGLTQEKLAEYLGLQPHSVTKIETGRTFVSSEVLASLCNFFEVSSSYFFNPEIKIYTEKDLNYLNEIKRILPDFSPSKLEEIYKILSVMDR